MDLALEIENLFYSSDEDYEKVVNLIVTEINTWSLTYLRFHIDEAEVAKYGVYEKTEYCREKSSIVARLRGEFKATLPGRISERTRKTDLVICRTFDERKRH